MLTDILGFDDLDLVIELISHRHEIATTQKAPPNPANDVANRLMTREEREAALLQQDYEHKHATLAPRVDREGPQYPHIYKAHNAGNKLAVGARKYDLPLGSERKDHDVWNSSSDPM